MNESANELQQSARRYQAYLVRLWRSDETGRWRVLAKNVQTGSEHHFASLEQYIAFVLQRNADALASGPSET